MQTIKKVFLIVFLPLIMGGFFSVCFAQEDAERPTCDFSLTVYSQYIWRGYELSQDSLVMFPSITIGYKGFGFNIWGDFDTDYEGAKTGNNDTEWWETDWVLTYSNSFKKLNYTLGWIYYDTDAGDDEELFLILGYDMFLSPEVSIWRGIEYGESWYVSFALSHSFEFDNGWSWDLGGWVSYKDVHDVDYSALHDGNIWTAVNIPINKYWTFSPSINYSFPLSNTAQTELRHASFDGDESHFVYGGFAISATF